MGLLCCGLRDCLLVPSFDAGQRYVTATRPLTPQMALSAHFCHISCVTNKTKVNTLKHSLEEFCHVELLKLAPTPLDHVGLCLIVVVLVVKSTPHWKLLSFIVNINPIRCECASSGINNNYSGNRLIRAFTKLSDSVVRVPDGYGGHGQCKLKSEEAVFTPRRLQPFQTYLNNIALGPGHDTSGERRASSVERHSSVTRAARVVTIQAARENSMLKRRVVRGCKRGIKRWGVHPINRRRRVYGEYHHLIKQLKEDPERFFQYTRMSVPTFDFILNRLKGRLEKKRIGSRGSCSSAILNRLKTVERSMTHLSVERRTKSNRAGGAAHCRSPLKSIVTPLFTFARQHMGPDCKALAERCRSDARRSTLDAHRSYRARGLTHTALERQFAHRSRASELRDNTGSNPVSSTFHLYCRLVLYQLSSLFCLIRSSHGPVAHEDGGRISLKRKSCLSMKKLRSR
ncbi:hypothetical protein J6590_075451 [Homalodisca vitripennis]|nr:hypothetical protein J6590_075451 [Homalodisca vitripennis]